MASTHHFIIADDHPLFRDALKTIVGTRFEHARVSEAAYFSVDGMIKEAQREEERHNGTLQPSFETGCRFQNVSFGYGEKLVLDQLSFEVPANKLTLLVGPSGAGKTTITDLLIGLYQPDAGCVLIDGVHAFPVPFIDWYYTANRLAVGGAMIVDDTHLRPCAMLRDFLASEVARWERLADFDRTTIFRRITAEPVAEGVSWTDQPSAHPTAADRLQRKLARYKRRVARLVP